MKQLQAIDLLRQPLQPTLEGENLTKIQEDIHVKTGSVAFGYIGKEFVSQTLRTATYVYEQKIAYYGLQRALLNQLLETVKQYHEDWSKKVQTIDVQKRVENLSIAQPTTYEMPLFVDMASIVRLVENGALEREIATEIENIEYMGGEEAKHLLCTYEIIQQINPSMRLPLCDAFTDVQIDETKENAYLELFNASELLVRPLYHPITEENYLTADGYFDLLPMPYNFYLRNVANQVAYQSE